MERFFLFGEYNTWTDWGLILTKKDDIEPPDVKTNYVEIDGMNGSLDLSESLSGEPTYKNRTFSAAFCACEGAYEERRALIRSITAALHGRKMKIIEPDDPDHYFFGRVKIKDVKHSVPLSEFSVECTCDPWRYELHETIHTIDVSSQTPVAVQIYNSGRRTVCPDISVSGQVTFTCCGITSEATDGSYKVTTFKLYQGENIILVSGNGTLTLTYRGADL